MSKPPIALETRQIEEGRLFSPSAGRNKAVVAAGLADLLPLNASILEIGSGTGEHGVELLTLRPDLTWQFSDPDPASRASQAAWGRYAPQDFRPPLDLDVSNPDSRTQITSHYECSLICGKGEIVSKMKLTLLGSVMAFGLAPQVVAQESTIVYADADTYEVVLDKPVQLELNEANFKSLRDLGIDIQPETIWLSG